MNDMVPSAAVERAGMGDLVSELERSGIVATTLGGLRQNIAHVDRLGKYVLATIEATLTEHGIGYFPETAFSHPAPRQHHEVRLYLHNSGIGSIVQAVLHPTPEGDSLLGRIGGFAPTRPVGSEAPDS